LTEWLVVALRPTPSGQENRFLAILGASGSGKSSLARAGLVAALKRGALDGSGDWPIVILKPGRNPIESLDFKLAGLPGGAALIKESRDLLNIKAFGDDQKSLHRFAWLALHDAPRSRRLVVLVDQSEEVFTLCEDEAARKVFFDNLLYAATIADGQAIVVLTMRADFYGKCGPYPALAAAMSDHQFLVGPMTEDELRRAIERPAQLAGGEFDPGLVEMLLQEVAGQPGYLPLLQYTLMELWQRRKGRRLTAAAYWAIGGLKGALERRANEVLMNFDAAQRDLCRRIFLRLTQTGEGIEVTKYRASFGELVPADADRGAVDAVVRSLADARLITIECDPKTAGAVSVEVAHEALIRGWDRLREWIGASRAGLRTHYRLTQAALEWEHNGRDPGSLYRGANLAVASEWAKEHRPDLNLLEAEFLAASVEAKRQHEADKEAAARRLAKQNQRMRVLIGIAAVLLLSAVAAFLVPPMLAKPLEERQLGVLVNAAQDVASTVLKELERLSGPVLKAAEDPKLQQLLKGDGVQLLLKYVATKPIGFIPSEDPELQKLLKGNDVKGLWEYAENFLKNVKSKKINI
jgi:hypothetical protein